MTAGGGGGYDTEKIKKKFVGDTAGHFDSNKTYQQKNGKNVRTAKLVANTISREMLCAD
jgi:hypothetical protein